MQLFFPANSFKNSSEILLMHRLEAQVSTHRSVRSKLEASILSVSQHQALSVSFLLNFHSAKFSVFFF